MEAKSLKLKQKADFLEAEKARFFSNNYQMFQNLEQNEENLYSAMINSGCIAEVPEEVAAKLSTKVTEVPSGIENVVNAITTVKATTNTKPQLKSSLKKTNNDKEVSKVKNSTNKSEADKMPREVMKTRKSPRILKKTAATNVVARPKPPLIPEVESTSVSEHSMVMNEINSSSLLNNAPLIRNDVQYLSLTKVKFDALPVTTRGRCKYSDISALYEKMLNYAQNYTMKPHALAQLSDKKDKKRRSSVKSSSFMELPAMSYTMKELIAGVPPYSAPFTSSLSAPKASTNKEYAMKISGKTGNAMLSILKALHLITYNHLNSQDENIVINLTDNVEDYMMEYVASIKKNAIANSSKKLNDANMSVIPE